jgi:hypothetical protein
VPVGGAAGGAQTGVGDHPVQEDHPADPQHAELLPDHGQDEVSLGLGQIEDLLDALTEADAQDAT